MLTTHEQIRCSGYQNTQNGKCTNCDKLRIDCVFQPVSSGSSTAFIPVSAVPGGVPPGTPLYGAYGQPLPPAGPHPPNQGPYGPQGGNGHPGHYPPRQPPQASPTSQYAPQGENRGDERTYKARRHPREDDEEDPGQRLPPPNPYNTAYEPRRRSPASADGTPPMYHYQHSTRSFEADRTPTPRRSSGGYSPTNTNGRPTSAIYPDPPPPPAGGPVQNNKPYGDRGLPDRGAYPSPMGNGRPSGDAQPSPGFNGYPPPDPSPNAPPSHSIMSLHNLLGRAAPEGSSKAPSKGNDIDNNMLGKLNKRH